MNKVLIVSATKGENYTLAKKIYDLCDSDICKRKQYFSSTIATPIVKPTENYKLF